MSLLQEMENLVSYTCTITSFVSAHPPPRERRIFGNTYCLDRRVKIPMFVACSSQILLQVTNSAEAW